MKDLMGRRFKIIYLFVYLFLLVNVRLSLNFLCEKKGSYLNLFVFFIFYFFINYILV